MLKYIFNINQLYQVVNTFMFRKIFWFHEKGHCITYSSCLNINAYFLDILTSKSPRRKSAQRRGFFWRLWLCLCVGIYVYWANMHSHTPSRRCGHIERPTSNGKFVLKTWCTFSPCPCLHVFRDLTSRIYLRDSRPWARIWYPKWLRDANLLLLWSLTYRQIKLVCLRWCLES